MMRVTRRLSKPSKPKFAPPEICEKLALKNESTLLTSTWSIKWPCLHVRTGPHVLFMHELSMTMIRKGSSMRSYLHAVAECQGLFTDIAVENAMMAIKRMG